MKILRSIFSALTLASVLSGLIFSAGMAAPSTEPPSAEQATVTFDMLGQADVLMKGPFATLNLRFGLPANWAFQEGASLQLFLTSNLVTDASQKVADDQFIGATLTVTLNNKIIATLPIV